MDNELENESSSENLTCSAYKGWRERERAVLPKTNMAIYFW